MKIIKEVEKILKNAGIEEYSLEAKLIVLELSGQSLEELYINNLAPKNIDKIFETAQKRADTKKPVQYLLNCAVFMNDKYYVDENVLIPRDETELLVRECFNLLKDKKDKIDVLDIGIGSGCISCALAKKLKDYELEILGVDINTQALRVALENINNLNLTRRVILRKSDIYSKIRDIEKFDLIVSNPPYIPIKQKEFLQKEVLFEPKSALFASDSEGIEFYEKIVKGAKKYLKPEGFIALELGINQAPLVQDLLKKDFKNIKITKDLSRIDRVISARLNT